MRGNSPLHAAAGWLPGLVVLTAWSLAGQTPFAMPGLAVLGGLAGLHLGVLFLVARYGQRADAGGWLAVLPGAVVIGASPYLMLPEGRALAALWLLYWLLLHRTALGDASLRLAALAGVVIWAVVSFRDLETDLLFWLGEFLLFGLAVVALPGRGSTAAKSRPVATPANASLRDVIEVDYVPRALEGGEIVEVLGREKARVDRHGGSLSVCLLAPDGFTETVRRIGPSGGDRLLQGIAERILSRVRQMDLVGHMQPGDEPLGRYGSHEFMVVLPETGIAGAMQLARRMRAALEELPLRVGRRSKERCSISVGVATYRDGERIQDLVLRAEEALQRARRLGGGRVTQETAGSP